MRYKIDGLEIRSHNAAMSTSQPRQYLLDWIVGREKVEAALDYGCGKLRYAGVLANRCESLTLVDSKVQVSRVQKLGDTRTTVRKYVASRWPHAQVLTIEEFEESSQEYDFALCANVLSAIPLREEHSRVLGLLLRSLKETGECLFVTQYRNSYFKKVASSSRATPHLDGWIINGKRRASYFGVIDKSKLEDLATSHGFEIVDSWTKGGVAYVLGGRPNLGEESSER